jgi:hypothetical protein
MTRRSRKTGIPVPDVFEAGDDAEAERDTDDRDDTDTGADVLAAYQSHSNTLRTWLAAYGVGAPVLFLTNEGIWKKIAASGEAGELAILFLTGVFLQVFLASVNKSVMWARYYGERTESFKNTRRFRIADWIAEQYWIDFLTDNASMVLFVYATYRAFIILTNTALQ